MNKAVKNIIFGVVLLVVMLIVRKLWLPEGIMGLFK